VVGRRPKNSKMLSKSNALCLFSYTAKVRIKESIRKSRFLKLCFIYSIEKRSKGRKILFELKSTISMQISETIDEFFEIDVGVALHFKYTQTAQTNIQYCTKCGCLY
jgi:hypothetical protein